MATLTQAVPSKIFASLRGHGFLFEENDRRCSAFIDRLRSQILYYCQLLESQIDQELMKTDCRQSREDYTSWAIGEITKVFIDALGEFSDEVHKYEELLAPAISCEKALSYFPWLLSIINKVKERRFNLSLVQPSSQKFVRKHKSRQWALMVLTAYLIPAEITIIIKTRRRNNERRQQRIDQRTFIYI